MSQSRVEPRPEPPTLALLRIAWALIALSLAALLFGPFENLETAVGLSDQIGHGVAFYGLTLASYMAFPLRSRARLSLMVLGVAAGSELLQPLLGRAAEIGDLAGDGLGVLAAYLPVVAGRFRSAHRRRLRSGRPRRRPASPGLADVRSGAASDRGDLGLSSRP